MAGNFHEQLVRPEVEPPNPRATGIVFAVVALIVALVFRDTPVVLLAALAVATALAALAWKAPEILEPVNRIWFRIGLVLHRIVNPVVMLAMFTVAIVPMGLLMRLCHDPLQKKPKPAGASYWIEIGGDPRDAPVGSPTGSPAGSMVNQF